MVSFLRRLLGKGPRGPGPIGRESEFTVSFDREKIVCIHPGGEEESIRWDDLGAVMIETNDSGPWGCDVCWHLIDRAGKRGCIIPQGATGEDGLLQRLQQLPEFDNEQVIEAMSSMKNCLFKCWTVST